MIEANRLNHSIVTEALPASQCLEFMGLMVWGLRCSGLGVSRSGLKP